MYYIGMGMYNYYEDKNGWGFTILAKKIKTYRRKEDAVKRMLKLMERVKGNMEVREVSK